MFESRRNIVFLLLLSLLGILFVVAVGMLWERRVEQRTNTLPVTQVPGSEQAVDHSLEYYAERQASALIEIEGVITALGNTCSIDSRCSFTVDGKTILYSGGPTNSSPNAGPQINMQFNTSGPAVGQRVQMKVQSYSGGTYSIINCNACYVHEVAP